MNQFQQYFKLGVQHILDLNGFDHILFILALCAIYLLRDWKKILILVAAFAVGHSIALTLAALRWVEINNGLIEFLIPVTISVTAFVNLLKPKPSGSSGIQINYLFALIFGLIHGLGFSSYLKILLANNGSLFEPLLGFNMGLGVGQLVIVGVFLLASSVWVGLFGVNRKEWTLVVSSIVLGMSIMMMMNSKFW